MRIIATVGDLIEALQKYDLDKPVAIAHNSGDYWHTIVTPDIVDVEEVEIEYSDYHQMNQLKSELSEDDEEKRAVVISTLSLDDI